MTTTPAVPNQAAATAAAAVPAVPSTTDMIAAIRAVQRTEAATIGTLCVAARRAGTVPLVGELVAATGLIAALDLAADVLTAEMLAGLA